MCGLGKDDEMELKAREEKEGWCFLMSVSQTMSICGQIAENGMWGLERKHLMACGDGFNDIPMMRYAGMAVAMENAQDETKEWADFVAPSNDNDGVAVAIEKYVL